MVYQIYIQLSYICAQDHRVKHIKLFHCNVQRRHSHIGVFTDLYTSILQYNIPIYHHHPRGNNSHIYISFVSLLATNETKFMQLLKLETINSDARMRQAQKTIRYNCSLNIVGSLYCLYIRAKFYLRKITYVFMCEIYILNCDAFINILYFECVYRYYIIHVHLKQNQYVLGGGTFAPP